MGAAKNVTVYVRNEGTVPVTLAMSSNAPSYLKLSWDYNGTSLAVWNPLMVVVTLEVLASTPANVTSFSCDFTITATG